MRSSPGSLARSLLLLGLLLTPAGATLRAAQGGEGPAGAPTAESKDAAAMTAWVRQVQAIVIKATNPLNRRLRLGIYRVTFTVDDRGRGSNYAAEGDRPDPKQSSMIMGALISRSFPAPPDGASHAVSFTLRNGTPSAKPPADAKPPIDTKPPVDAKPPVEGTPPLNLRPGVDDAKP